MRHGIAETSIQSYSSHASVIIFKKDYNIILEVEGQNNKQGTHLLVDLSG